MANSHWYIIYSLLALHLITSASLSKFSSQQMRLREAAEAANRAHTQFTKKIGHEIFPATQELLHHFKGTFSLIVEPSTMYTNVASKIVSEFNDNVLSVLYLTYSRTNYSFARDYESVISTTLEASREARVVILLMDLDLAKECLVAAHDLQLNTGDHVFVVFEVDLLMVAAYKRSPFKWSTTDFLTSDNESLSKYLHRNRKLCWMWEHTFVVMVTLPRHMMHAINRRRDWNAVRSIINMGKVMKNGGGLSTVGDYNVFMNKKGTIQYPLAVYRYGKGTDAGSRCADMLTAENIEGREEAKYGFPEMHPVAKFHLTTNEKWCTSCPEKWKLSLIVNSTLRASLPVCIFPAGGQRNEGTFRLIESVFIISGFVLLVLVFIVMYQEFTKTRIDDDFADESVTPIAEYKQPVDV